MGKTTIEWTDASWNPIVGCTEISPGCANCYAARLAATRLRTTPAYRGLAKIDLSLPKKYGTDPRWTGEVRFLPERLEEPMHWKKPRRIFVCDMGDLFHEDSKPEWIADVFQTMAKCPRHTFQILTKRPAYMREFMTRFVSEIRKWKPDAADCLPNVWLGVSVENQHFADERIPLLLQTPAAVRWISAEPLLGPVNLQAIQENENFWRDAISGIRSVHPCLDWVVAGGESGPNARPMHPDWARSLRDQCQAAGVPFFFKQWGEHFPVERDGSVDPYFKKVGKKKAGRLLDGREWNEYPCAR